jgi:hypothetical protein
VLEEYGPLASGVVRLEAPVARGCTALQWLAGQAVVGTLDEVGISFLLEQQLQSVLPSVWRHVDTAICMCLQALREYLVPQVYFSGRHSAAPDTAWASRAEGATRGWSAVAGVWPHAVLSFLAQLVLNARDMELSCCHPFSPTHSRVPATLNVSAGVGAARQWQGAPREGFGGAVVQQMQRFLSADHPRIRILGGTR